MKWVLVMYFFYFSAYGGWQEVDRLHYPDYESCIKAQKIFEIENPNPTRIKVRCKLLKAE